VHEHQQTFASYDPARPLPPWVFTIATNKVRDFWRSRRHESARREITLDDEMRSGLAVAHDASPDRPLEKEELETQIRRAVDDLPDSMRVTLELRYFQGMSFAAIGEIVQRNETAVRKRYSRALEELRGTLGRELGREREDRP
jgi:RNA polymerase sigma-70 factor (ECF subfamily)